MSSPTKENYLKAIYSLDQRNRDISVTHLSKEMNVSVPTANNMVKNLQEMGWVVYTRYKPLRLTEEGRRAAARIVRKHRLAEMFLTRIMGFGWEEVHDIAEDMEHIRSEKLFDRMDKMLEYPREDPHGSPIPDKQGRVVEYDYIPLSAVEEGQLVRLRSLRESSAELLDYLNRKNIRLGTELLIRTVEPFDKSFLLRFEHGGEVILPLEICQLLEVEPVS
jgi:DtxR family Mn-dependent transcriptional regulator